jgi:hypothetical protein
MISLRKCRMAESTTAPNQETTATELCFHKLFLHEQNTVRIAKVKTSDQKFSFFLPGGNNTGKSSIVVSSSNVFCNRESRALEANE